MSTALFHLFICLMGQEFPLFFHRPALGLVSWFQSWFDLYIIKTFLFSTIATLSPFLTTVAGYVYGLGSSFLLFLVTP